MDIENMTDEQISEYLKLRQQENPSDYSYQQKGPSKPGIMGTALVEVDKNGNTRKSKQYLNSITPDFSKHDTTEPSAKQETTAAETMRGADGNYDVSKVNLSKMFSDKANERSYTDNETGEKKSYNKGSKWQAYIDKNVTDPAAKADMEKQMQDIVSANPNMNPKELKFRLRAVEANLRRKYPNGVSKNFDISGGMLDSTMAKDILALGLKGGNKPAETKQPDTAIPPAAETPKETQPATMQKPAEQKGPTTNDELNVAFKKIKNKQASDADLALFSKYSEEQLKKMGFGPISIAAIKSKKEEPKPVQPTQPAQPAQSNDTLDDNAFMKQYTTYAGQRTPEARKFMSDPANIKRYQEILKKKKLS